MSKDILVIDIETVGNDWDSLEEWEQQYLLKNARTEDEEEVIKSRLGLSGLSGEVVVIGVLNPAKNKAVLFCNGETNSKTSELEDYEVHYIYDSEKKILEELWKLLSRYNHFVTYNGRAFDFPFLVHRSILNGVKMSRDLDFYRYSYQNHLDLMELLHFRGMLRNFSLDYWCRKLEIKSPKEGEVTAVNVAEYYKNGEITKIADYCLRDINATWELYLKIRDCFPDSVFFQFDKN